MKNVYGIFTGETHENAKWSVCTNKIEALKFAKLHHAKVMKISWGLWRDCGYSMDAPTFYAQADFVAKYGSLS